MGKTSNQSIFFEIFLKLGVIFYLLGIFDNTLGLLHGVQSSLWEPVLRVILIIFFIGLGLITVALRRENFRSFAFLLIFVISALKIFTTFASNGFDLDDIPTYTLLMVVSIYILYRTSEHSHSRRR